MKIHSLVACSKANFPTFQPPSEKAGFTSKWTGFVNTGRLSGTDFSRQRKPIPSC